MKVIEVHAHIWPREKHATLIRWLKRHVPYHYEITDENSSPDDLIAELMDNGAESIINLVHAFLPEEAESLNRFNADLSRRHKGVIGFATVVPGDRNKEDLLKRAFFELGLMGLKIHAIAQRIDLSDPEMEEVWSCCEKWGRPVYLHTGFEPSLHTEVIPASSVRGILKRHPQLNVVVCHSFFPHLAEGFQLADEFPNLYLDITGVPVPIRRNPEYIAFAPDIERALKEKLPNYIDRTFMGSDHPVAGETLPQVYEDLVALGLGEDLVTRLTYTNPKKFIERFRLT